MESPKRPGNLKYEDVVSKRPYTQDSTLAASVQEQNAAGTTFGECLLTILEAPGVAGETFLLHGCRARKWRLRESEGVSDAGALSGLRDRRQAQAEVIAEALEIAVEKFEKA